MQASDAQKRAINNQVVNGVVSGGWDNDGYLDETKNTPKPKTTNAELIQQGEAYLEMIADKGMRPRPDIERMIDELRAGADFDDMPPPSDGNLAEEYTTAVRMGRTRELAGDVAEVRQRRPDGVMPRPAAPSPPPAAAPPPPPAPPPPAPTPPPAATSAGGVVSASSYSAMMGAPTPQQPTTVAAPLPPPAPVAVPPPPPAPVAVPPPPPAPVAAAPPPPAPPPPAPLAAPAQPAELTLQRAEGLLRRATQGGLGKMGGAERAQLLEGLAQAIALVAAAERAEVATTVATEAAVIPATPARVATVPAPAPAPAAGVLSGASYADVASAAPSSSAAAPAPTASGGVVSGSSYADMMGAPATAAPAAAAPAVVPPPPAAPPPAAAPPAAAPSRAATASEEDLPEKIRGKDPVALRAQYEAYMQTCERQNRPPADEVVDLIRQLNRVKPPTSAEADIVRNLRVMERKFDIEQTWPEGAESGQPTVAAAATAPPPPPATAPLPPPAPVAAATPRGPPPPEMRPTPTPPASAAPTASARPLPPLNLTPRPAGPSPAAGVVSGASYSEMMGAPAVPAAAPAAAPPAPAAAAAAQARKKAAEASTYYVEGMEDMSGEEYRAALELKLHKTKLERKRKLGNDIGFKASENYLKWLEEQRPGKA